MYQEQCLIDNQCASAGRDSDNEEFGDILCGNPWLRVLFQRSCKSILRLRLFKLISYALKRSADRR